MSFYFSTLYEALPSSPSLKLRHLAIVTKTLKIGTEILSVSIDSAFPTSLGFRAIASRGGVVISTIRLCLISEIEIQRLLTSVMTPMKALRCVVFYH
jgi:hypothetical protein